MRSTTFSRTEIKGGLTDAQCRALTRATTALPSMTPKQMARRCRVRIGIARAIIVALGAMEAAELFWLIYHDCDDDPVVRRPFSRGFAPSPWTCPRCGEVAEPLYEVCAAPRGPVAFE